MQPNSTSNTGIIQLQDPQHMQWKMLSFVCYGTSAFIIFVAIKTFIFAKFEFGAFLVFLVPGIIFYFGAKFLKKIADATAAGIIFDLNDGTLEFSNFKQGNNMFETLTQENIQAGLQRTKINIADIKQMTQRTLESRDNQGRFSYKYLLGIQGTFGAYEFTFGNENKRSELAAHLSQAANMGTPVVIR